MYTPKNLKLWRQTSEKFLTLSAQESYRTSPYKLINLFKNKKKYTLELGRPYILKNYKKKLAKYIINRSKTRVNFVQDIDLYYLRNAYLTDITIIYDAQKEIFPPSIIDSTEFKYEDIRKYKKGDVDFLNESILMIFKSGKNNYGHLLIEILPKLFLILKSKANINNTKLFVPTIPSNLKLILTSVLTILEKIHGKKIEIYENKSPIIQVEELLYCGPISNHSLSIKSPIIKEFSDFIKKNVNLNSSTNSRIFVDRDSPSRMLENRKEVVEIFKEFNFLIIDPALLTFEEQVNYFKNAEFIAGTLGAGMTNIIFAEEGTRILMIDPGLHDFFFPDLASLAKLNFSWYLNDLFGYSVKKSKENYRVDQKNIRSFLEEWLK